MAFVTINIFKYINLTHHGVLPPVRQAVVHCDLLSLGDVSDCYDNQPHLRPTMHLSDAAVWGGVEQDRPSDATRSFLPQLWYTTDRKSHDTTCSIDN